MTARITPQEALEKAIEVLGSQTAVAAAAGPDVETGHVYYWLNKAPEVPPRYCPGIERATREKGETVFCEQLCPGTDWASVRSTLGPSEGEKSCEHAQAQGEKKATRNEVDRIVYGTTAPPSVSERPKA